jgi:hypothetical protein
LLWHRLDGGSGLISRFVHAWQRRFGPYADPKEHIDDRIDP